MHPSENPAAPGGVQTRLAAPGGRTRAISTRTTTVRPQITPSHTLGIHWIPERMHPNAH